MPLLLASQGVLGGEEISGGTARRWSSSISPMEDFNKLTMRGRARRLRALAERALDLWDLDVQRLGLLCNETNGIFRIDTADGRKLALRIYDPSGCHGRDDITLEASWLAALGRETDLGVPVPMATRGGDLMALVEAAGVPEPRFCMMQSWIPGPDLEDRLTPVNYEKLGTFTARLHVHADGFTKPHGIKTRTLDNVFPYVDPEHEFVEPIVIFDRKSTDLFSGGEIEYWQASVDAAQLVIDGLYRSARTPRIIHQDLHPWNTKVCRGRIYAFDFEDVLYGHPVQDIATALFYVRFRDQASELIRSFRSGYEKVLPWPVEDECQMDALIAARALLLVNFLLCENTPESRQFAPEYIARTSKRLAKLLPDAWPARWG
jgi:Ser/Thr protein kinase RdoA (MazF antagonist)